MQLARLGRSERVERRWVLVAFLAATLARLAGQAMLGAYQNPQVFEYEEIANNLVAGRGYTFGSADGGIYVASQSSPLYILLTALVYLVTDHSHLAMLVLQAVLGGITAALAMWIAWRGFSRLAGILAGLLVAIDPALVVFAGDLHSLTLDAFFNVALVAASVAMPARPSRACAAGVGALFGVAALSRATALVLVPVHVVWLVRFRAMRIVVPGLALVVVAVLLYAPWPVRNSLVLGQLSLGSSESTEWLWRGNNPNANGGSLTVDGQRMIDLAPAEFRARVEAANESQRMTIYRDAAYAFIRSEPLAALNLYLTKLGAFWWGTDTTGMLYPDSWLVAYRVWYIAIGLLAVLGTASSVREPKQRSTALLILATLLVISASQAVFYVEGRHRIGVEPLVLILASAAPLLRKSVSAAARNRLLLGRRTGYEPEKFQSTQTFQEDTSSCQS